MASNYKRLGDYIQQVDVRNTDERLGEDDLYGLSVYKEFISTHANLVGVKFNGYKVVSSGQFTYIPDTSRRGDKIAIGLNSFSNDIIVSSVYTVFEITKPDELNAEYLMMLFRNSEFDRFARYNSWGSAREVFSWEDFCNSKMYIPDIEEQQKIVRQYKTITDRIGVLEKINEELIKLSSAVLKIKLDDSDRHIPFEQTIELYDSKRKPISGPDRGAMKNKIYPYYGAADLMDYVEDYIFDDIYGLIAEDGSVMNENGNPTLQYVWGKFWLNNHAHIFQGANGYSTELVYLLLKDIDIREIVTGAVQLKVNQENLRNMVLHVPNEDDIVELNNISQKAFGNIRANRDEIKNLKIVTEHLLRKLS